MAENQELVGGRYRILGRLGKGAMGVVYMAHDPVLDRKVAIKQMTAEIAQNEDLRQRFYVEARAAARLNHPHIITIHELQEVDGEIYMVMEMLEGKPLAGFIEEKPVPLPLETTLDVMAQVCDGLDYAHQHAIVHRDVKPANLFVCSSGVVKILDFGIARLGSLHMTATGALVGTPDYMSPEQVRGDEIDRRTDVWAAGAVLYQLLSGAKPFEGRPLAKLLMAITQNPHVPLQQRAPALPKTVCDLVDRMLSKPRDQRPATAGLVRDELRAILGRESVLKPKVEVDEDYGETLVILPGTQPGSASTTAATAARTMPTSSPAAPPAPPAQPAPRPAPPSVSVEEKTAVVTPAAVPPPLPVPAEAHGPTVPAKAGTHVPTAQGKGGAQVPVVPAKAGTHVPTVPGQGAVQVPTVPTGAVDHAPTVPAKAGTHVQTPVAPAAAAPAPAPAAAGTAAAPRKRTGLVIALVALVALVVLAGGAAAAWWFAGPRLLKMAGLSKPATPAASVQSATPPAVQQETQPAASSSAPASDSPATPVAVNTPPAGQPATSSEFSPAAPAASPSSPFFPAAVPESGKPAETRAPAASAAPPPTVSARQPQRPANSAGTGQRAAETAPAPAAPAAKDSRPAHRADDAPTVTAPRVTEQLTQDTVATLSGRRSGAAYGNMESGASVAAVNRINWVLEQYAGAIQRRDAEALREYRPSPNAAETQLLGARSVSLKLEVINVQVDGTSATARCQRTVEATLASGAPLRQQGSVTFALTRRPTGWVITDVR